MKKTGLVCHLDEESEKHFSGFIKSRMFGYRGLLVMFVIALLGNASLCAVEILHETDEPNLGQTIYELSEQTWKSRVMTWPGKVKEVETIRCGVDFFENEFGRGCAFDIDFLKKYGHCNSPYEVKGGELCFTSGKKGFSFGFGPTAANKKIPSIRFGRCWQNLSVPIWLEMEVEQDVEKSDWTFYTTAYRFAHFTIKEKFEINGKGRQVFRMKLFHGNFWYLPDGFVIKCLSENVNAKIRSIKIVPYSAYVHFRKTFPLSDKPVIAHASFIPTRQYDLYVNGKRVSGSSKDPHTGDRRVEACKTVDLKPYLVKGKNVIAFRKLFVSWSKSDPSQLIEAVAVTKSGDVTRIVGDKNWKTSVSAPDNWSETSFDDSVWIAPRTSEYCTTMADDKKVATGLEPEHMGMLLTAPLEREQPIFDIEEPATFVCKLPAGVKGKLTPKLTVFNSDTEKKIGTVAAPACKNDGDFIVYEFKTGADAVGPYRLEWELLDGSGTTVEKRTDEMVVVGPVAQDKISLADFEKELSSRMTLVQKFDCSQTPSDTEFIDHSGMHASKEVNKGKVVTADGMTYRETGLSWTDYFAYRLHGLERNKAHIVEVIVPDNRTRLVYSGVVETYPIGTPYNYREGKKGWFATTGACMSGCDFYPLSNKKVALRYVYYPGSKSAAVVVMSGLRGAPAAACEINVYSVEGGLPALDIPENTERTYGQHSERFTTMSATMASENPYDHIGLYSYTVSEHRNGWLHWYKALARKIRWLRYQGQNMACEGLYMYNYCWYPSAKEGRMDPYGNFDVPELMLRMYARNNIRCFVGMEYYKGQTVTAVDSISDRKVKYEKAQSVMAVDKDGKQQRGVNFLDPRAEKLIVESMGDIFDRYRNSGKVDGLFLSCGRAWLPTLSDKVGYDDYTAELFSRETGIKLDVDASDPERFAKRHDILMGNHKGAWREWKSKKVKQFLKKISDRIKGWPLYIVPDHYRDATAFEDRNSTREERDNAMGEALRAINMPVDYYYGKDPDMRMVAPIAEVDWCIGRDSRTLMPFHGWNTNRGTREIVRKLDNVYFSSCLNELDCPAKAAKRWLWQYTARAAFDVRGPGENCMYHVLNSVRDHFPKNLFVTWLDCNMVTAHGEHERRFAKAFLSTPIADFKPMVKNGPKGVTASLAKLKDGSSCLRLVNASPHALSGTFTVKAGKVRDLVFDRDLSANAGGYKVEMKPSDIRLFRLEKMSGRIGGEFTFVDEVEGDVFKKAEFILGNAKLVKLIPADLVKALKAACEDKDGYAAYSVMNDFEITSKTAIVKKQLASIELHRQILDELEKKSVVGIDCGSTSFYMAPNGIKWFPDTEWLDCGAYGSENSNLVDRGSMPIAKTDIPRVYQTEAYGSHVFYRVAVPNGAYNVTLHVAETFGRNNRPGARAFAVKLNGKLWRKKVDPFADSGGFATALALKEENIMVNDGMIVMELIGAVGVQGIEIERVK